MPILRNKEIPGAKHVAAPREITQVRQMIRLTRTQAKLLPCRWIYMVKNTEDRGHKWRPAAHYWEYYARAKSILSCRRSTPRMKTEAARRCEAELAKLLDSLPCC